jgi:hypothetical protein
MFNAKVFRQCKSTALQKIAVSPFANRYSPLAIRRRFGSAGASPYQRRMNSALRKIRHQPLAKASGMDRKILKGSHSAPLCTLALTHAYTPARLHACTQDRSR